MLLHLHIPRTGGKSVVKEILNMESVQSFAPLFSKPNIVHIIQ